MLRKSVFCAPCRPVFEPLQESVLPNPHVVDRDGLVAYFGSMGWISSLPDDERAELLTEVRAALDADTYELPFETAVYSTRRRPST